MGFYFVYISEPKSLVTVGQPSSIDDSEALDEINLNTSSEDSVGAGGSSPYLGAGDQNANPLLEPPTEAGNDSLLSQAASSFTALPAVASNVFSTFSKRIYAGSRETSEEPKLDIQPSYIQQASYVQPVAPVPAPFYAAPPAAANEVVAPEPPKFYAPTEVPPPNVGVPAPPPTSGNPNTYRFTARKKLYAPIPGLSEQSGQPAQQPQVPQAPQAAPSFQTPPYPPQLTYAANPAPFDISAQPAAIPAEERKSGGGLFSLTSLVPTGVLQNITGIVQSATGRSSEPEHTNVQQAGGYLDITTASAPAPSTNLFGGPNSTFPPGGNYFVPGAPTSLPSTGVVGPPSVGNFFAPAAPLPVAQTAAPPAVGAFFTSAAPSVTPSVFTPGTVPPLAPQPFQSATVNQSALPPNNPPTASAVGELFVPAPTTIAQGTSPAVPFVDTQAVPTIPLTVPPGNPPPTSTLGGFFTTGEVAPVVAPFGTQASPATQSAGFFNPGEVRPNVPLAEPVPTIPITSSGVPPIGLFPPAPAQPGVQTASNPNPLPGAAAPPPAAGQASYRLQKGTRLYKSPLTPQETATSSGFAAPLPPTSVTPAIFNPFGAPAPGSFNSVGHLEGQSSQGVPFFTPPVQNPPGQVAAPTVAVPQSAPIAPPPGTSSTSVAPPLTASIANPPPTSGFASVPLFAAPTISSTPIPFFNPQPTGAEVTTGLSQQENEATASTTLEGLVQGPAPTLSASQFFDTPLPTGTQPENQVASVSSERENLVQEPISNQGIPFFAPPQTNIFTPQLQQEFIAPAEDSKRSEIQEEFLSAPPQESNLSTELREDTHTGPPVIEPVLEETPASSSESSVPPASKVDQEDIVYPEPSAPVEQEIPLFVPVPGLPGLSQDIPLYPPPPTGSTTASSIFAAPPVASSAPLFVPVPGPPSVSSLFSPSQVDSTSSLFAPPPTSANTTILTPAPDTTSTLFANNIPTTTPSIPDIVPTTSAELVDAPPGFQGSSDDTATNLFQGNTETQTVFSPFAQTKATPLVQETKPELVPPPIGFFAPKSESEVLSQPPLAPSPLQSFFSTAPETATTTDFNFFGSPAPGSVFPDLPVQQGIAPPPLALESPPQNSVSNIATSAIGFDLLNQTQQASSLVENSNQNSSVNSFDGYFGGPSASAAQTFANETTNALVAPAINCDPVNFFDQVPQTQSQIQQANEDQRIQNFFNNPPLQDQPAVPGELKYDIVHSGVAVKQLQERSQTPVSNLVEPPSSACSEFSTLAPAPTQTDRQSGDDLLQQHLGELPEDILRELRMASASSEKGQVATPPVAIVR